MFVLQLYLALDLDHEFQVPLHPQISRWTPQPFDCAPDCDLILISYLEFLCLKNSWVE